ncbi:MAG: hypothetical protein ACMVY4_02670 [Minwuia sp.]|uniref:hypothetical protein n=1 Tax=Minwuia sp. TaxID=2493630 RepID=UPI003A8BEEB0
MKIATGILTSAFLMIGASQALAGADKTIVGGGWIASTGTVVAETDESLTMVPKDRPHTALTVDRFGVEVPQDVAVGDEVTVVGELNGAGEGADVEGVLISHTGPSQ